MKLTLTVYSNSDDALLMWTVDELDPNCIGFGIQRRSEAAGAKGSPPWLENWAPPGTQPHQIGAHQSSEAWPFRAFSWTDHSVDPGDTVSYCVVPVVSGSPAVREDLASAWSRPREISDPPDAVRVARFNRGFVMSQFVSRYLEEHYGGMSRDAALEKFKEDLGGKVEDQMRVFLSGQVRTTMLDLLARAKKGHLFAAVYELGDEELVEGLTGLGPKAHVVLANGSISQGKKETVEHARGRDGNAAARKQLLAAGVDVQADARFIAPRPLAHNKFAVLTDAEENPLSVWTGSTNWTTTGLCTQLNNGLLVTEPALAQLYLDQWHALRNAASEHPPALAASNSTPGSVPGPKGTPPSTVQFTRANEQVDLAALEAIVLGAEEGVLFLMFMPGSKGVLSYLRDLEAKKPDLLVRGVVSELPRGPQDEHTGDTTTVRAKLLGAEGGASASSHTFNVVQPQGFPHPVAGWAVETTREQFLSDIGFAIIHSKVLVVDPFSAAPTVVTGSHNFSLSASENNDENYVVIRGDRPLAEAYAVNIQSAWRHYAARLGNPHAGLTGIDYLNSLLADQRREAGFWHL